MKLKKIKNESGSYSIEASISLIAFLIAIMFIYSQIKTLIAESIMQHAVNSMAAEMSTYVYVLDRAGLIIDENEEQFSDLDGFIGSAGEAYGNTQSFVSNRIDSFSEIYAALENDDPNKSGDCLNDPQYNAPSKWENMAGEAESMVASIKNMAAMLQAVNWKEAGTGAVRVSVAEALKSLANNVILSNFYNWKLDAYLPMEREEFCKKYMIDSDTIDFGTYSAIIPDNKSVVVAVSYETKPAFKMFPVKRKIVKFADTAAWVKENANKLK